MRLMAFVLATFTLTLGCGRTGTALPAPDSGIAGASKGELHITVGAPVNSKPKVDVVGPGGYAASISSSTTLTGLAAGHYVLSAAPLRVAGAVIATEYASPGATVDLPNGASLSVRLSYAPIPGSGRLWVGDYGLSSLGSYSDAELGAGGDLPLGIHLDFSAPFVPAGMAFDAAGNLWVSSSPGGTIPGSILKYSPAQLGSAGPTTPATVFTGVAKPGGIAFDAQGNLWVANQEFLGSLVRFNRDQLGGSGGALTPSGSVTGLHNPLGIAFGPDGSLYAVERTPPVIWKFTPDQLAVNGPTPVTAAAEFTSTALVNPAYLAFDGTGALWIGMDQFSPGSVPGYTATQLAAAHGPQTIEPAMRFMSTQLDQAAGLAFDDAGDLWVTSHGPTALLRFARSAITTAHGGSLGPTQTLTNTAATNSNPLSLVFSPPGLGTPLKR